MRQVREDRYGRVVENLTEVAPAPAHNIQLSIDERLQTITEDALDNAVALEQGRVWRIGANKYPNRGNTRHGELSGFQPQ